MNKKLSKLYNPVLIVLSGVIIALAGSTLITLFGSLLVCIGMHPHAWSAFEIIAPILGLASAALWVGRRVTKNSWLAGAAVGIIVAGLWMLLSCYLLGKYDLVKGRVLSSVELTYEYYMWWGISILLCSVMGMIGGRKLISVPKLLALVLIPALIYLAITVRMEEYQTNGLTVSYGGPTRDGSTLQLMVFSFNEAPSMRIGLYDTDSDDDRPLDDRNTTWLGMPMEWAFNKVHKKEKNQILCLFNAGFFNLGAENRHAGSHVAPIVVDGKPLYNVRAAGPDEWTFGITEKSGKPEFHLDQAVPFKELGKYQTAIGHVRPLIVDGKPLPLGPGSGVTKLKCSRTSIAWTDDPKLLWVLVVRDPDGELAGIKQMESGKPQTGGFDLEEIQKYWMRFEMISNAVVLDGGDSTQIICLSRNGYSKLRSGYLFSKTLGYWRNRPIRLFIPILPTPHSHTGVMNYLYVTTSVDRNH